VNLAAVPERGSQFNNRRPKA